MGKTGQLVQGGVALLLLAGLGGGIYLASNPGLEHKVLPFTAPKTDPKPPANAPVGFNAAKTEFVLPHNLGYLPKPELALAKSDPTYAAGLANPADWKKSGLAAAWPQWEYDPRGLHYGKVGVQSQIVEITYLARVASQVPTTSVLIRNYQAHAIPNMDVPGYFQEFVSPTALVIVAAPVGATSGGTPRFCVPTPVAFIDNGRVFTPSQFSSVTAGPSVMFWNGSHRTWEQGRPSCVGFN